MERFRSMEWSGGLRYTGGKWLLNKWAEVIKKASVHQGVLQEEGGHCQSHYKSETTSYHFKFSEVIKVKIFTDEVNFT